MESRDVRFPLQTKVMLFVSVALVAALSGAGAYAIHGRRQLLEEQLERRARALLVGLEAAAREAMLTERRASLRVAVEKAWREDKDIQALRVRGASGAVLAGSPPLPQRAGPAFFFQRDLQERGFPLGRVELVLRRSRIRQAMDRATVFLLLTLLDTILLVGFTVHMALKRMVTRPLERLGEATAEVARGDFTRRVPVETRDEIGLLARSFNQMGEDLERYRGEVQETHRTLEQKVEERTRELRDEQARTTAILEHLPVSVLVVDEELRLEVTNPAARELTGAGGAAPTTCRALLDTRFCREDCLLARARRGEPHLEETRVLGPDGEEVPVLLECAPLGGGGIVNVRDISRLKAMDIQIRRSDRLSSLGTLAAGLAHELNNPLGNVSTYAQLARERLGDPDRLERSVSTIQAEAERASEIVGRLLAFARPESGRRGPVDLRAVCASVRDLLEPVLRRQGVGLELAEGPSPPAVSAEPGQLQQVLVNLVQNAAQATGSGGRVVLEPLAPDAAGRPGFRVLDDGPGVDEALAERLFDPFFTTKEVGAGTGLGLSVCYGIVEEYDGEIRLGNREEGGAVATVRLPRAADPGPDEAEPTEGGAE